MASAPRPAKLPYLRRPKRQKLGSQNNRSEGAFEGSQQAQYTWTLISAHLRMECLRWGSQG
jgi:hypothetical protein